MKRSNDREVASSRGAGARTVKIGVTPPPWQLHSSQRVFEEIETVACPWRVQPCRKRRRLESGQESASGTQTTGTTVTETI